MSYELAFDPRALKEWHKLGDTVRAQFIKKLMGILNQPHVESARLAGFPECYKIKLKTAGYRLVYQVREEEILILVIAIGKREKSAVYRVMDQRLDS